MNLDHRKHPRFCPDGLIAQITIVPPPPENQIKLEGRVLDMSYSGIKIKLDKALGRSFPVSDILISLVMPSSGVPVSIRGMIKHTDKQSECGLQYTDQFSENSIDDLMFECIKVTDKPILI